MATTCLLRVLYELNCLRDPSRSLGLGAGEPIHIVPISRSVKAAQRVVFGGLEKKLALSPWFKGRYKSTMDYIEFPGKKILIVGGASGDAACLGLNVFSSILDEMNFMGEVKQADKANSAAGVESDRAQMIYDALVRRVKSRYQRSGVKGMIYLVSSKRSTDDFTERRIKEHIKNKTTAGVFIRDYNVWQVQPQAFANQKWYRCSVSSSEGRCRILEENEPDPEGSLVFPFPEDYYSEFERDPSGSTRDIGGVAIDSYAPFITKREAIEEIFDPDRPHLFDLREWEMGRGLGINWNKVMTDNARGERVPWCCPNANRHVHIDLSKNMCATGLCLAHQGGLIEVVRVNPASGEKSIEEVPVFHVDGILRILAGPAGDIDHSEIRSLIYKLNEGGFNIRSVSMDHWMSVPNMQIFKKRGYRVEEISTVKKIDPYDCMRAAIYENRIQSPEYDILRQELRVLELDPKRRPERPRVIVPPGHCFTGDTRVKLLDGRSPTFKELANEFGDGRTFYVYTMRDNKISVGRAHHPRLTINDSELVEIELNNGNKIRCTPDHRFMLNDGSYLSAQLLAPGQQLMPPRFQIVDVKFIDQREDVYDLTVDETHNFALEAGIFVHNSKDVSDAFAGCIFYLSKNSTGGVILTPTLGDTISTKPKAVGWSDGDPIWADEEGYDALPDPKDGGADPFGQAWIV